MLITLQMAFIYKTILGELPLYLSSLLNLKFVNRSICSLDFLQFVVPKLQTELGMKSSMFCAPCTD